MEVRPYTFDPALSAGFLRLCWRLYGDDPSWIPPEREGFLRRFEPEFEFYRLPGAAHRHFAAVDGGEVTAHVSAFVHPDLTDDDGQPVGSLGCFEAESDDDGTQALLETALAWLDERARGRRVWAPVDFDIWHGYRFRIRGFDERPFLGEPYNLPWYPGRFERLGFVAHRRWNSIEVRGETALRALAESAAARYHERIADGYRFEPVDTRGTRDLERMHRLVSDSFRGFSGFTPLSLDGFTELYGPLWRRFGSHLTTLVFDPSGEPVGFCMAYPDAARAVRVLRGERTWFAGWRALRALRRADRAIYYLVGITQAELARRHGLGRAAFHDTMRRILRAGYRAVVFGILAEGSPSRSLIASHTEDARVEYALYQRDRG